MTLPEKVFTIYTAQLNIGKVLKYSSDYLFVDITLKSGTEPFKSFFAPSWDLLKKFKTDSNWSEFQLAYLQTLNKRYASVKYYFNSALAKVASSYRGLVLGCYCGDASRCHRTLVANFLNYNLGLPYGGEIKKNDIAVSHVLVPNRTLLKVPRELRAHILQDIPFMDRWRKVGVSIHVPSENETLSMFSTKRLDEISEADYSAHVEARPTASRLPLGYSAEVYLLSDNGDGGIPWENHCIVATTPFNKTSTLEECYIVCTEKALDKYLLNRCYITRHSILN